MRDQCSLIKGNPLALVRCAIHVQPVQIGRRILSQLQGSWIAFSGLFQAAALMLQEIPHGGVQQLARGGVFSGTHAFQYHPLDVGVQPHIHNHILLEDLALPWTKYMERMSTRNRGSRSHACPAASRSAVRLAFGIERCILSGRLEQTLDPAVNAMIGII